MIPARRESSSSYEEAYAYQFARGEKGSQTVYDAYRLVEAGALGSAVVAIGIFLLREAGRAMDRFAQWCGLAFCAIYGAGILIAGFLPPPSPDDSATENSVPAGHCRDWITTEVRGEFLDELRLAGAFGAEQRNPKRHLTIWT